METKLTQQQNDFFDAQQISGIKIAKESLFANCTEQAKKLFGGNAPKDKATEKYIANHAKVLQSEFLTSYNKALRDIASEAVRKEGKNNA